MSSEVHTNSVRILTRIHQEVVRRRLHLDQTVSVMLQRDQLCVQTSLYVGFSNRPPV
jgi:hypothetical protein